jgi:pimeloyl-ACP methyl ester carboxylesterase
MSSAAGIESNPEGRRMPEAGVNGIRLYYEIIGSGVPLLFVHEFAGDSRSWDPQVRFFARRYQAITYNARGYPPSEVPEDPAAYSQDAAVEDLRGLILHLGLPPAHLCGLSMGGYAVLHVGLRYPELARSLVIAGCGYGSDDQAAFSRDAEELARRIEGEGMATAGPVYARGPYRQPFLRKDPHGWQEFADALARHSSLGSAYTMRGVQARRPAVYDLRGHLARLALPTLILTGDEDDPCLAPSLFLKQHIASAGLLILPKTGHTINLEEPEAFNRGVLDFLTLVESGHWPARENQPPGRSALLPDGRR